MTWYLVVRHSPDYVDGAGKAWPYPPEGFAITAYNDPEQAKRFAEASNTSVDRYEVIPVVRQPAT